MVLCLLAYQVCAKYDAALFEAFGRGWDERWVHSTEPKYTGKFDWVTPQGFGDQAIKVAVIHITSSSPGTQRCLPVDLCMSVPTARLGWGTALLDKCPCGTKREILHCCWHQLVLPRFAQTQLT